jgi:hypothetical protein
MRICLLALPLLLLALPVLAGEFPIPQVDFATWRPLSYPCVKTETPPVIDGKLDDAAWDSASWTDDFVDIEGDLKPKPRFRTQVKMLWDDEYFYVAADMEEPHLWGTLTERDAVIYYDNDFEIFIDPDGDTHNYYELEINALGTVWDLLLTRPYRDGGHAVDSWNITGLKSAVHLDGTLNDPSDTDRGWSVEIAMPWKVLEECAWHGGPPRDWETWRVNFSRVQWRHEITDGMYAKAINPATGKSYPENNWVWSPQGLIAMHYPEMWGCVMFHGNGKKPAWSAPDRIAERHRLHPLRLVYYAQKYHFSVEHEYASGFDELTDLPELDWTGMTWNTRIHRPMRKGFWADHSEGIKHHLRRIDDLGLIRTLEAGY